MSSLLLYLQYLLIPSSNSRSCSQLKFLHSCRYGCCGGAGSSGRYIPGRRSLDLVDYVVPSSISSFPAHTLLLQHPRSPLLNRPPTAHSNVGDPTKYPFFSPVSIVRRCCVLIRLSSGVMRFGVLVRFFLHLYSCSRTHHRYRKRNTLRRTILQEN